MVAFDRAEFSARVARQPRVTNWIYIPRAHALANFEAGRHLYIAARGHTLSHQYDCFLSGEGRRGFGLAFGWDSALDLAPSHQIALHEHLQKSDELSCVVTHLEIFRRWNQFALVTRGVNVPLAPACHGAPQREDPALPRGVKNRLVLLILNGAHPVHPAPVMYAIHVGFPSRRADQSPNASDRAPTCTRPAADQVQATDSTSTACKPRGCAPWGCSRPPACARPAYLRIPTQRWRRRRPQAAAVCKRGPPRLAPPLARHCAGRSCARSCQLTHPEQRDPPAPFPQAAIRATSPAAQDLKGPLGDYGRDRDLFLACGRGRALPPLLQPLPHFSTFRAASCPSETPSPSCSRIEPVVHTAGVPLLAP